MYWQTFGLMASRAGEHDSTCWLSADISPAMLAMSNIWYVVLQTGRTILARLHS